MTVNELIHELEVLRDLEGEGGTQVEFLQRTDTIGKQIIGRQYGGVHYVKRMYNDGRKSKRIVLLADTPESLGYETSDG